MADIFSKETRSHIMSKIRSKKTKPELAMKEALRGTYMRYQPNMHGNPDFANKSKKVAVFIDGCFWHGCPKCYKEPQSRKEYWVPKIKRNKERDKRYTRELRDVGWTVIRIWEHEVLGDPKGCRKKVMDALMKSKK